MPSDLSYDKLDTQAHDIGGKYLWQHCPQPIEEEFEEPLISIADRHVVLQSDVPHTEQTAGKQRDNYRDHRALRVIGIMDVYATPRCLIRRVKEGIEAVKYRLQFLKSATFLKLRLYLVDFSF